MQKVDHLCKVALQPCPIQWTVRQNSKMLYSRHTWNHGGEGHWVLLVRFLHNGILIALMGGEGNPLVARGKGIAEQECQCAPTLHMHCVLCWGEARVCVCEVLYMLSDSHCDPITIPQAQFIGV